MAASRTVFKLMFILIPILGLIILIYTASHQFDYCSESIISSKKFVMANFEKCAKVCWKKHSYGSDLESDDCFKIEIKSGDEIKIKELEEIHEETGVYIDHDLPAGTTFKLLMRYNSTKPEISILNYGFCGNKFIERGETCDGDISGCNFDDFGFGLCSGNKKCSECSCESTKDCSICSHLTPTVSKPDTDNDWCKFCSEDYETDCNDEIDNDCDGDIDQYDGDCVPPYMHINIFDYWANIHYECDKEHKRVWRCNREVEFGYLPPGSCDNLENDYQECIDDEKDTEIPFACPSQRSNCDTRDLDYDRVFLPITIGKGYPSFTGKIGGWAARQRQIIVDFIDEGGVREEQLDYMIDIEPKIPGFYACLEIPEKYHNKQVYVDTTRGTGSVDFPALQNPGKFTFTPRRGEYYVMNLTGIVPIKANTIPEFIKNRTAEHQHHCEIT